MDDNLRQQRERLVRQHIADELVGDAAGVIASFARPRYDLVAPGVVLDGVDPVAARVNELARTMPGAEMTLLSLRHSDDAVIVETSTSGLHLGPLLGVAPTGRTYVTRGVAIFRFEGAGLVEEIVYYDRQSLLEQLTGPANSGEKP